MCRRADGTITRIETLERQLLYAIDIDGGGSFDLCPADACLVAGRARSRWPRPIRRPSSSRRSSAIARAVGLDVGGIEVMIDDRDGVPRFYDINALSNFVAKPLDVLGWDPHDRLVDYLVARRSRRRRLMRYGYWMPVFGGWLRNVPDEGMAASWDYVRSG